ncbi:MAG: 3-dehydroquinate dehydratase [Polyangiaceae bacterium]|nr:3-dehydroquinate dehydratase [Polyangiaceae bacterium]
MVSKTGQIRPKILCVSGPNLQLLGTREPEKYGQTTYKDLTSLLQERAEELGVKLVSKQSNSEEKLVTWVGEAGRDGYSGVLLNPGGYTHTSVALLDAVLACGVPVIEVHLTQTQARESFRHVSYVSQGAFASVSGFGVRSYVLALEGLYAQVSASKSAPLRGKTRAIPKRRTL